MIGHSDGQGLCARRLSLPYYLDFARQNGVVLTDMRRLILATLWRTAIPLGAYDLTAETSRQRRPRVHPNSIYRALTPLEAEGLVIRIALLRRYALAPRPEARGWLALICSECGGCTLLEAAALHDRMRQHAVLHRMRAAGTMLEALGHCSSCSSPANPAR